MQIKSLLAEKERLNEDNRAKIEMAEADMDRNKGLEMKLSQVYTQKEALLKLLERLKNAMPSDHLQRVFSEILESIYEGFTNEEELFNLETQLLNTEGELRQYAKREVQGLLSTKVINLRKDVERQR